MEDQSYNDEPPAASFYQDDDNFQSYPSGGNRSSLKRSSQSNASGRKQTQKDARSLRTMSTTVSGDDEFDDGPSVISTSSPPPTLKRNSSFLNERRDSEKESDTTIPLLQQKRNSSYRIDERERDKGITTSSPPPVLRRNSSNEQNNLSRVSSLSPSRNSILRRESPHSSKDCDQLSFQIIESPPLSSQARSVQPERLGEYGEEIDSQMDGIDQMENTNESSYVPVCKEDREIIDNTDLPLRKTIEVKHYSTNDQESDPLYKLVDRNNAIESQRELSRPSGQLTEDRPSTMQEIRPVFDRDFSSDFINDTMIHQPSLGGDTFRPMCEFLRRRPKGSVSPTSRAQLAHSLSQSAGIGVTLPVSRQRNSLPDTSGARSKPSRVPPRSTSARRGVPSSGKERIPSRSPVTRGSQLSPGRRLAPSAPLRSTSRSPMPDDKGLSFSYLQPVRSQVLRPREPLPKRRPSRSPTRIPTLLPFEKKVQKRLCVSEKKLSVREVLKGKSPERLVHDSIPGEISICSVRTRSPPHSIRSRSQLISEMSNMTPALPSHRTQYGPGASHSVLSSSPEIYSPRSTGHDGEVDGSLSMNSPGNRLMLGNGIEEESRYLLLQAYGTRSISAVTPRIRRTVSSSRSHSPSCPGQFYHTDSFPRCVPHDGLIDKPISSRSYSPNNHKRLIPVSEEFSEYGPQGSTVDIPNLQAECDTIIQSERVSPRSARGARRPGTGSITNPLIPENSSDSYAVEEFGMEPNIRKETENYYSRALSHLVNFGVIDVSMISFNNTCRLPDELQPEEATVILATSCTLGPSFQMSLQNLRVLDLSYNNLETLPQLICPNLRCLILQDNQIIKLNFQKPIPPLVELNVERNLIVDLIGLEHLPALRRLNVRGNDIKSMMEMRSLAFFPNLEEALILQNPVCLTDGFKIKISNFLPPSLATDCPRISYRHNHSFVGNSKCRFFHSEAIRTALTSGVRPGFQSLIEVVWGDAQALSTVPKDCRSEKDRNEIAKKKRLISEQAKPPKLATTQRAPQKFSGSLKKKAQDDGNRIYESVDLSHLLRLEKQPDFRPAGRG